MGMSRGRPAFIVVFSLLLAGSVYAADPDAREAAKQRAYEGVSAYEAGNYDVATRELEAAFMTLQVPTVALWSARALEKTGKWVEAVARYARVAELPAGNGENKAIQEKAKADAAAELKRLLPRLPAVRVAIENAVPEGVVVTLDGAGVPPTALSRDAPVNPGPHELVGSRGSERTVSRFNAVEGGHQLATLTFAAPSRVRDGAVAASLAPPPSSKTRSAPPLRTVGLVSMGVGAAGLLLSGVSALVALGKQPDGCSDGRCKKSQASEVDAYDSWRTISTISFWTGAVIAPAGAVVYFTAPRSGAEVAVHVTPSYAGVSGRF
jgi:hypothetical protein